MEQHCGEPSSKEVAGHSESGDTDGMDLEIEKWVYGPEEGYYCILYFKAGVLVKVQSERVDY